LEGDEQNTCSYPTTVEITSIDLLPLHKLLPCSCEQI
jgi:hypothetical protein